ncbi:MAG: laccase domain-containing protein [Acidimicrobiales bacterium]
MCFTGRAEGDLRPVPPSGAARLSGLAGRPVSWLRQVHGNRVVVVGPEPVEGDDGDSLVTTSPDAVLAVLTADCAPLALGSPEGVVAAVHAGWAGLAEGVVERAVDVMRALGATRVEGALGPCVHAGCYEFGATDLDRVAAALGPTVRAVTGAGAPALDLPAGVRAALTRAGATLVWDADACTACEADRLYSHRARRDGERQAMLVWKHA